MFENESAALKEGIEFMESALVNDLREDPAYDIQELRDKIAAIGDAAVFLDSNLVPEVADDLDEAKEEFADDTLEEDELEDEYVECYNLIERAKELYYQVIEKYGLLLSTVNSEEAERLAAEERKSYDEQLLEMLRATDKYLEEQKKKNWERKKAEWEAKKRPFDWSWLWIPILLGLFIAAAIYNG